MVTSTDPKSDLREEAMKDWWYSTIVSALIDVCCIASIIGIAWLLIYVVAIL